jgi:hypothetical protein
MRVADDPNGWVRFRDRWPTPEDADIYGNVEIAGRGLREFKNIVEAEDNTWALKEYFWWRSPTPLPYITG